MDNAGALAASSPNGALIDGNVVGGPQPMPVAPAPEGDPAAQMMQMRQALLVAQERMHELRGALDAQLQIATQLARRCEELERWKKQVQSAFHEVRGLLS